MAATGVQWALRGTNFRENIANLLVSRYDGNNDRSAWVLFVQHPRYARVLTPSFALLPRVLDEQHPSKPSLSPNCLKLYMEKSQSMREYAAYETFCPIGYDRSYMTWVKRDKRPPMLYKRIQSHELSHTFRCQPVCLLTPVLCCLCFRKYGQPRSAYPPVVTRQSWTHD